MGITSLILSGQYMTPWLLMCPMSTNILTILTIFPDTIIPFLWKTLVMTLATLLSPYKASGPGKIPNIVLMKCVDALIDHLFFIFRAIFKLNAYHPRWLESITLVLCKISKTSYDVAKSYHPIGLIDTMPKVLSTLCTKHTSFLAKKHNMLPTTQFGGHWGCNTTDAMLLVVHKIKSAWWQGKVAAALFLDIQGAFLSQYCQGATHP